MGLGNQGDDQSQVFVMCADLPRSPGHVFYDRLQTVLIKCSGIGFSWTPNWE